MSLDAVVNVRRTVTVSSLLVLAALVAIWFSQHHHLLPEAAAVEAQSYDGLFSALIAIATALFFLVQGLLVYSLFRFRQRQGDDTDGVPFHDNFALELIWTVIPTVTVIWIGIYSFDVYNVMHGKAAPGMAMSMAMAHHHHGSAIAQATPAPPAPGARVGTPVASLSLDRNLALDRNVAVAAEGAIAPLNIDVTAMQFAWIFTYPDTGVVTAEMHVPVGRKVHVNLNATDVIHAFWVPQFRLKQDAIPGLTTFLEFTPSKPGEYPIVCTELCGSYHGGMRATLIAQSPAEFDAWMQSEVEVAAGKSDRALALNPASTLTEAEYLAGRTTPPPDLKAAIDTHRANPELAAVREQLVRQAGTLSP